MSYGSYSQPFNPTAGGPAIKMDMPQGQLPGAQDPNSNQYFQQMHQGMDTMNEALQQMEQGPRGQFGGGGKSAGGQFFGSGTGGKSMPALEPRSVNEWHGAQTTPVRSSGPFMMKL